MAFFNAIYGGIAHRARNIIVLIKEVVFTVKCKHVQKMLVDYVNEILEPEDGRRIQEHITECETCRRELDILRSVLEFADDVKVEYPPASVWDNFLPDLHRRIENEAAIAFKTQWSQRLYLLPAWATTAAAILVLFASLMLRDQSSITVIRVQGADNAQIMESSSLAEDSSGSMSVAGVISNVLITEAEAEKLRELRGTIQSETLVFPYYYHYDDDALTDMEEDTGTSADDKDVIQYLEDEFTEFDESLMIEADDSEFGAI